MKIYAEKNGFEVVKNPDVDNNRFIVRDGMHRRVCSGTKKYCVWYLTCL